MRYTEPKILKTGEAISAIQQITWTWNIGKSCGLFLDSTYLLPAFCTLFAYEADE
jgi:hypothetical protein